MHNVVILKIKVGFTYCENMFLWIVPYILYPLLPFCIIILFTHGPMQFASGISATVIGKPSPDFFKRALSDLGVVPEEVGHTQITLCGLETLYRLWWLVMMCSMMWVGLRGVVWQGFLWGLGSTGMYIAHTSSHHTHMSHTHYRAEDERHSTVTPDKVVDNLAHAVDLLLNN